MTTPSHCDPNEQLEALRNLELERIQLENRIDQLDLEFRKFLQRQKKEEEAVTELEALDSATPTYLITPCDRLFLAMPAARMLEVSHEYLKQTNEHLDSIAPQMAQAQNRLQSCMQEREWVAEHLETVFSAQQA